MTAGPIGTGKTHLVSELGTKAVRSSPRVAFVRATDLVHEVVESCADGGVSPAQRPLQ